MTIKPYQLMQKNNDTYELIVYGDIGESYFEETISAKQVIEKLSGVNAKEIVVRINSNGGSAPDGLAIYNALHAHDAVITTVNEGMAVSIAGYLLMAGTKRTAYKNSIYMVHAPSMVVQGNSKDLRNKADVLDKFSEAEVSTFTQKTNLTEDEVRTLLTDCEDHWYTAEEALQAGFVTEIVDEEVIIDESFSQSCIFQSAPLKLLQSFAPEGAKEIAKSNKEGSVSADSIDSIKTKEVVKMPKNTDDSAAIVDQKIDVEQIQKQALDDYKARSKRVGSLCQKFNIDKTFTQSLIDGDDTMEQVNDKILQKLAEDQPEIRSVSQSFKFNSGREDAFRSDVIQGLSARANVKGAKRNEFSQYGFREVARECCVQAGINVSGMSDKGIIKQAITHSTSDFGNIFENVMHKAMLDKYNQAKHTWRSFCGVGDLSDFRAHNRYRPSSFGDLKRVLENGEFKNVTVSDAEKETITASSKGMIFNLSYEMLVNDDMGVFLSTAGGLGMSAQRSLENDVYALLNSNPLMSDGTSLFHASHNNMPTGAAISMAALDTARVAMRGQKDVGDNDFLDISPAVLLTGIANGGIARQTIASEVDPSKTNSKIPNIVRDMAEVVDTPRISGSEWYLFADPLQNPAIEVGFLNGVSQPEIVMEESFNSRGIKYRVAFDYGVAAVDHRAAVKNVGA